jgi:hypothetical protein
MGKGSGDCDRHGISLAVTDSTEPKATLSMNVVEIDTTLEIRRVEHRWWTKDERVSYRKCKEGWIVDAISDSVHKAFKEYGLICQQPGTSSYEHTHFLSLKTARKAVRDVSLEAGLNIDLGLTRQKYVAYKIGDLPLAIRKEKNHWRLLNVLSAPLHPILKNHFDSTQEFRDTWYATGLSTTHYPSRKAAHQAVINGFSQIIAESNILKEK